MDDGDDDDDDDDDDELYINQIIRNHIMNYLLDEVFLQ